MQYNKGPNVIETNPSNYSTDVAIDIQITVRMDADVSKTSITGNVHLYDKNGKEVDIRLSYSNRTITISPRDVLQGSSTYRLLLQGDNDPESTTNKKGLCTPLNDYMLGDYSINFSTYSNDNRIEEIINGTPNNIMIVSQPVIKFDVTSNTTNPVVSTQVQISYTNTFEKILVDSEIALYTVQTEGFKPNVELADGLYYWRARVKDKTENGNWSETYTFNINTIEQLPVVDEDSVPIDSSFPSEWNMTEPSIISVFPKDNATQVPLNLKTIAVVIDQIISEDLIKEDMITLTGAPVDDDDTATVHGIIEGTLNVAYDYEEGTTTLLFSLPDLTK